MCRCAHRRSLGPYKLLPQPLRICVRSDDMRREGMVRHVGVLFGASYGGRRLSLLLLAVMGMFWLPRAAFAAGPASAGNDINPGADGSYPGRPTKLGSFV